MNNLLHQQFTEHLSLTHDNSEAEAITSLVFENVFKSRDKKLWRLPDLLQKYFAQLQHYFYRLSSNEPLQHILGKVFFLNCTIKVNKNVLIPRPETEELTAIAIKRINKKNNIKLIDVCSGSGCIAIAIAKKFTPSQIYGLEKSEQALEVAQQNATINQVKINWILDDIFKFDSDQQFDYIISNPPYVKESEKANIEHHVLQFEPHVALFVSDDRPLIFYEQIKKLADKNLNKQGVIFLEVNTELAEAVKNIFHPIYTTEILNDMFGKPRFVIAQL